MDDLISRQALCEYALNQKDKSITPNDIMRFPSAEPETHEKRTETHACDCISRQAAVDAVESMLRRKFGIGGDLAEITLAELPSAQPVLTCKGCKYDYYEYAGCRICLRKERDLYEPE